MAFVKMVTAQCDACEELCQGSGQDRRCSLEEARLHGWKWRGKLLLCKECVADFDGKSAVKGASV